MEAQYGKFLDMIRAVRINVPLVDVLAGMPNYGKFLKELMSNKHKIEQNFAAFLSDESFAILQNKVPPKIRDPGSFLIPCNFNKTFSCNALDDLAKNMLIEVGKFTFPADFIILEMEEDRKVPLILGRPFIHTADAVIRVKQKQLNLRVGTERMIFNINSAMKHSYSNDDTCFSIDVIDEILEEDFDTLLDEGSKILHSIEGTLLEEEIFSEFDEFMAMTADENSDSKSDTEEAPFEKITINADYKIKTSLEEPPKDLELKPLPNNLEYVFLEEPYFLPVIISSKLSAQNKSKLIQLLDDKKPVIQKQRRLNSNMQEVVKKKTMKLLDIGIIYPIADSPWVSPIHCLPKKGGITVVTNEMMNFVPHKNRYGMYAKPRLIRWILLLQEFDIEIKDRKGTENVVADHLSRIENEEISDDGEVDDKFSRETLMEINNKDEPWFTDFANYLVADIIPKGMTYQQKNKFFSDSNTTFGRNPTLSKYF
ncbi:reverse transcriptase domain-containing protein [Tanacetum coccineum]